MSAVLQSGSVTPGGYAVWVANGVIGNGPAPAGAIPTLATVPSVAALSAAPVPVFPPNSYISLIAYYAGAGTGGGILQYVATSVATPDNFLVFNGPNGVGRYLRVVGAEPVTPEMAGAVGNGIANDTAALNAVFRYGGLIYANGTYSTTDITVTAASFTLYGGGRFVQNTGGASFHAILTIPSTCKWYEVHGVTFDGSISTLASSYAYLGNGPNGPIQCDWIGIQVTQAINGEISDCVFQNFATYGMRLGGGATLGVVGQLRVVGCRVTGCGMGIFVNGWNKIFISNMVQTNINCDILSSAPLGGPAPPFQHVNSYANNIDSHFDFTLDGFSSTTGLEPQPRAVEFLLNLGGTAGPFLLAPFQGMDPFGGTNCLGINLSGCGAGLYFKGATITGWNAGLHEAGSDDIKIAGLYIDGQFQSSPGLPSTGVIVDHNGITTPQTTSQVLTSSNNPPRRVTFIAPNIKSCGTGMILRADGLDVIGGNIVGNTVNGILVGQSSGGAFPETYNVARNIRLFNVNCYNNGQSNLSITAGDNVIVSGGYYRNGGQDSTVLAAANRSNIEIARAAPGIIYGVTVTDMPDCSDDQSWTQANAVSFKPGVTDANGRFFVTFAVADKLDLYQRVLLKNAGGPGVDCACWIYAWPPGDLVEVQVTSTLPFTFSASGNLTTLTGTWTSDPADPTFGTLDGSGTNAINQVPGACWATPDGGTTWFQILRVTPPYGGRPLGSGTLNPAVERLTIFPAPGQLTGATLKIVLCNTAGVPSAQYPLYIDKNTVGPISLEPINAAGCANPASYPLYTNGISCVPVAFNQRGAGYASIPTVSGPGGFSAIANMCLVGATVAAGGTGYRDGEFLQVQGGNGAAEVVVLTDHSTGPTSGAVALVTQIALASQYTTLPGSLTGAATVDLGLHGNPPGTGTGCTLNLSFGVLGINISVNSKELSSPSVTLSGGSPTTPATLGTPIVGSVFGGAAGAPVGIPVAGNFTVVPAFNIYYIDASGGACTGTLPAILNGSSEYQFWDSTGHATANNISLNGNGNNVSGVGGTNAYITINYGKVTVQDNGTQYLLVYA